MIRLATPEDAQGLFRLNEAFNGKDETSLENIKNSLLNNQQEVVIVAEESSILVGFVCVQMKKSFCYDDHMPEITEVFVADGFRRRKLASSMLVFAEAYCRRTYTLHKFELLTGKKNLAAQAFYESIGYRDDGEIHLTKEI